MSWGGVRASATVVVVVVVLVMVMVLVVVLVVVEVEFGGGRWSAGAPACAGGTKSRTAPQLAIEHARVRARVRARNLGSRGRREG